MGGKPEISNVGESAGASVITDASSIRIKLCKKDAIRREMLLWRNGEIAHHCNGKKFLSSEGSGEPCGCPSGLADQKRKARLGLGPQPMTSIFFRIDQMSELGTFSLRSNSWDLAESAALAESGLQEKDGNIPGELALDLRMFKMRGGLQAVQVRPILRIVSD